MWADQSTNMTQQILISTKYPVAVSLSVSNTGKLIIIRITIIIIFNLCLLELMSSRAINTVQHPPRRAALYREGVKPAKLLPHTAHSSWINRTGLTSWALTRWSNWHTSNKVAHYSIYRPQKNERLSWPSWLTYSGWLTHISGHLSATERAWVHEEKFAGQRHVFCHCAMQPITNQLNKNNWSYYFHEYK